MTTDHPNGGPFTAYPRIISWLMSKEARGKLLKKLNKRAQRKLHIESIDREYTFSEATIVTRAGTARALGLKDKGHLGVGADADIAIYNIDPSTIDPSRDYRKIRRAFKRAAYTIKDGRIVVKEGEIVKSLEGSTYWVDTSISKDLIEKVRGDLKERFNDYYSISFENYPVRDWELTSPRPIKVQAVI
jgi:formylmethanofuran dehydrogenase subunit A